MMKCDSSELAAAPLSVRFWGVRGSIPSPGPETAGYGGNTSCVELRRGNEVLVLDAGSGIRRLGIALAHELEGTPLTTTLLISHTHWDHIQGLPFFRPAYTRASQIRILGAPGTRTKLRAALTSQMDPIQFPISIECLAGISAIDEFAAGNEGRRLGQPGRVPERADLAPRLVARTRPAIEPVERRRVQEQGFHHAG